MSLVDDLKGEVYSIFVSAWETREGRIVPETDDIGLDGNEGVKLEATVLYADIDGSTTMVDTYEPEFAAEVYKAYLHCASKIIKAHDGVITAYDGDRIMAVFIGDNKNTSAVRCGLKIHWAVDQVVNPLLKEVYTKADFELRQVVGIDTSKLLAARTGVRGANDIVWVGSAANHAAKLTNISDPPYSTFISEKVYKLMNKSCRYSDASSELMWDLDIWEGKFIYKSAWWRRVDFK